MQDEIYMIQFIGNQTRSKLNLFLQVASHSQRAIITWNDDDDTFAS